MVADRPSASKRPPWTWIGVLGVWMIAATLWSLAAISMGLPPGEALWFGAGQMGVAGVLAAVVWRLSAHEPWRPKSARFLMVHLGGIGVFATSFTAAQGLGLARERSLLEGIGDALTSPVTGWNLLMGGILYLAIVGVSYARRAEVSLRESERARAEARVTARDAQLAALNAQLQPHFLFNALHTVSALVHTDPDRADRALDDLGKLLRYALRQPSDEVTLRQEWDFARDYLAFEALRLGPRLRLELEVEDGALSARVPPFLVQPLVENALRHGAVASPGGGTVAVRIAQQQNTIRIVIRNSVTDAGRAGPGMAGSGLRRLRERLALTYPPERTSLEVVADGSDFVVTLTVPADAEDTE